MLRATKAAAEKWASSYVRGLYKAISLKLDIEIPEVYGSVVMGGVLYGTHIKKVHFLYTGVLLFHNSVSFTSIYFICMCVIIFLCSYAFLFLILVKLIIHVGITIVTVNISLINSK